MVVPQPCILGISLLFLVNVTVGLRCTETVTRQPSTFADDTVPLGHVRMLMKLVCLDWVGLSEPGLLKRSADGALLACEAAVWVLGSGFRALCWVVASKGPASVQFPRKPNIIPA